MTNLTNTKRDEEMAAIVARCNAEHRANAEQRAYQIEMMMADYDAPFTSSDDYIIHA